nr:unnamed protein product [Callosobruchus analis]
MSPVITVSLLILTVALPFLAAMIAIYTSATVHRKHGENGNITARADIDDIRCDDYTTRLVSIVRYMYPDMPYAFKFACTGVIVGEDTVLTVPECFAEDDGVMTADEITDAYFVSSGSQYWLNMRTVQKIDKIREFVMMDGQVPHRLKVLSVLGALPECTSASSSITLDKEGCEYSFVGWNDNPVKQQQEYTNYTYRGVLSEKPCTNFTGGGVFKGESIVALLRSNCQMESNGSLPPNERYTLLWDYQEKIKENFPHAYMRRKDREEAEMCRYLNSSISESDSIQIVNHSNQIIPGHSSDRLNERKFGEAEVGGSSYGHNVDDEKMYMVLEKFPLMSANEGGRSDIYKVEEQIDKLISEKMTMVSEIDSAAKTSQPYEQTSIEIERILGHLTDNEDVSRYSEEKFSSSVQKLATDNRKIIMKPEGDPLSVIPLDQSGADFYKGAHKLALS